MNRSNIVITTYEDKLLCVYENDGRVEDLSVFSMDEERLNSVYIGKVKNIVKNINAAFVDIAPGRSCFLSLEDCASLTVLNRNRKEIDLHQGDEILVQLVKGAVKSKAPVVTGKLRLPKNIKDEVISKASTRACFSVLYSGQPEYLTFFNRFSLDEIDKITCANDDIYDEVMGYIDSKGYSDDVKGRVSSYIDDYPLNKLYKIDTLIDEITSKHIWLKSGANLVIEYTEALTVIDVNTAKSIRDRSEHHILDTNIEAAEEVFRQIKLRNLSGMILVDFINDDSDNTDRLIDKVKELAAADYIKCEFIDITGLGIVELTRAKRNRPVYELLRKNSIK